MSTFINDDDQAAADAATYEDEVTSRRTVTIPLREYDKLKEEQHYITDPNMIAIIDKIGELPRNLDLILADWLKNLCEQLIDKTVAFTPLFFNPSAAS